jgi:endonuclease-3
MIDPTPEIIQRGLKIHESLLLFYGKPTWRNPLPPLDELVSTILSQNTNDQNRDKAFSALRGRFKSWDELLTAPEAEIESLIRPAGLAPQKAPRIKKILHTIHAERGDLGLDFLKTETRENASAWLQQFQGVGPKTAAIVLLFSLDIPAFPVDTHIYRVTGRLGIRPEKLTLVQAHPYLERVFPPHSYYSIHLNIIRLGREICHPRKPVCGRCPLQADCQFDRTKI